MKSSPSCKQEFTYGAFVYTYDLIKQNRKSLSLTVTPDLQIYLKCPHHADAQRVELFLKRKWFWLEKQLRFFGKYQRKKYKREYVSGESFRYLGRQYKLVVQDATENKVVLSRGALVVSTTKCLSNSSHTKKLITLWYKERLNKIFQERFEAMKKKFDYKKMPVMSVHAMKRRWGSYINNDKVILNPKLIHVSKDCIDYVIVHELCHMRYKNHDKRFFKFMNEKYPGWEKIKDKLEVMGALVQ